MEAEKIRGEAKNLEYRGIELTYCELGAANSDVIVLGAFALKSRRATNFLRYCRQKA